MIIYYIKNWDWPFIYHFLYYTIGGFRHLEQNNNEKPIIYIPYLIEDKKEIDIQAIQKITNSNRDSIYPKNITKFPRSIANLYFEMLDLIQDKFTIIYSLDNINLSNYRLELFNGEKCGCFVPYENPFYIRNLFLSRLPSFTISPNKRIYITRKNSENISTHLGVKKRHVLNEDEIMNELSSLGFKYIQLEDYTFKQKVELFASSEIIISPNSGGLSFIVFANKSTRIIELFPNYNFGEYNQTYESNWNHRQFLHVANILELNYTRFSDMTYIENELNMKVNVKSLCEFINNTK